MPDQHLSTKRPIWPNRENRFMIDPERSVMEFQSKYFSSTSRAAVILCSCGQTLLHSARVESVQCPTCGAEEDLSVLVGNLIRDTGTANPEDYLNA